MNDEEMKDMLSGGNEVKTFAGNLINNKYGEQEFSDNVSRYIKQKDADHVYIKKAYTDYSADMYSNDDRDNKMPSGSVARIASKMNKLSEEAYRVMLREAEDRNISILDVILEKARDRVIQPDVLDELEQKAVEDKFSKIPDITTAEKYNTGDGIDWENWNNRIDTKWK